jgi:hypothetical protein
MDINVGLLTLIGELKVSSLEKDEKIANLVNINNELVDNLSFTKKDNAMLQNSIVHLEKKIAAATQRISEMVEDALKDTEEVQVKPNIGILIPMNREEACASGL